MLVATLGCGQETETGRTRHFGPAEGAAILVVFYEHTTHEGINDFDERIHIPETEGRKGHRLPEGVSGLILVPVAGREGYSISLWDYSTMAQRREVLQRVVDHPAVEVVLTDTSADEATQQYLENGGWVKHVYYRGEAAEAVLGVPPGQDQEPNPEPPP